MAFDSPCELVGVGEAPEGKSVPFILVRIKCPESREKYLLKSGEGVSWEVRGIFFNWIFVHNISFRNIAAQCLMVIVTCR